MLGCMHGCYPGHLESAARSCGASGPAVGVCANGSVRDHYAPRSAWRGRVSGSGSRQGNAWEMHSQSLNEEKGACLYVAISTVWYDVRACTKMTLLNCATIKRFDQPLCFVHYQ